MTFENKIDTHYLACMHSRRGGKYKSGWLIVSYTHSQNFPDFAFWDTSTNCLQLLGFFPEQSRQIYENFERIDGFGGKMSKKLS